MFEWIALRQGGRRRTGQHLTPYAGYSVTEHPDYFSALDIRPAAITTKLRKRSADAYDFAARANPSITDTHYDRRKEKKASATE